MSRPGYALALAQVMRSFPQLTLEKIIETTKKELKISANDSKRDQGQAVIGQVMLYMAIIRTERIKTASAEDLDDLITGLKSMMSSRSYVEHICCYGLANIISQVTSKRFSHVVSKALKDELQCGWEKCTANTLLIILHAARDQPKKIGPEFLKEHWSRDTLINKCSMEKIIHILLSSASLHPVVHPVCTEVLQEILQGEDKIYKAFWSHLVTERSATMSANRRYLIFMLLGQAVTSQLTSARLRLLLSDHVTTMLIKTVADKSNLCHIVAKKSLTTLCDTVLAGDGDIQFTLLQILITPPGSILFDSITSTQTIVKIVGQLNLSSAQRYFDLCLNSICCQEEEGLPWSVEVRQKWAIHQLSVLAAVPSVAAQPLQTKILQLLFLHSFFNVVNKSSTFSEFGSLEPNLEKSVIQLLQTTFVKTIDKVTSLHQSSNDGGVVEQYDRFHFPILFEMVNFIQLVMDNGDFVTPRDHDAHLLSEAWKKLKSFVDSIQSKATKTPEDIAFLHLCLQLSHQLFADLTSTSDILEDLQECYKKLNTKRRKSITKKVDSEPEWVEVLTDLFLGLLSRPSHLIRRIVQSSYALLVPHVTQASVTLILDVLKSDGGEDDMVDFEDDSDVDEMDQNGEEEDEEDDDQDEDNENLDEDHDDEDEDVSDEEADDVDEELKNALKQALGEAAAASDVESESDLSDSEMFKLDEALSKAFKSHLSSRRRTDQEQRMQLMHFKIRLLDLLAVTVTKHACLKEALVIDILVTLVDLLCKSSKHKDLKPLVTKSSELLQLLHKVKKVDIDPGSRCVTQLVDTLKHFMKLSQKELAVAEEIKRACVILVRMCHADIDHVSPARTRSGKTKPDKDCTTADMCRCVLDVLRETLLDYFYRRDTHVDPTLYMQLFTSQARFLAPLLDSLSDVIGDNTVKVFSRTQACTMLNLALNRSLLKDATIDWKTVGHQLLKSLEKALTYAVDGDFKAKFLQVLLLSLHKCDIVFEEDLDAADVERQRKQLELVSDLHQKHKNKDVKKALRSLQQILARLRKCRIDGLSAAQPTPAPETQISGLKQKSVKRKSNGGGPNETSPGKAKKRK